MKYLIITYDEYINMPYIANYEERLRQAGNEFDVVVWNRSGHFFCDKPNFFVFEAKNTRSKLGKVIPFFRWRQFVLSILKNNQYDRIIVLTTIPAVLLADQLLTKYARQYWLDIRDYTYEGVPAYKKLVGQLAQKSYITSISSEAFAAFLPNEAPIVLTHNLTNNDAEESVCSFEKAKTCYTVAFVGGVRYIDQNKQLLHQLANNPRYHLKYIGKTHPGCNLQPFCQEYGIQNVEFFPAYINDQKPQIYSSIDLINSIYGNDSKVVTLALPNKLYDCVLYKKPIIVSSGTYLAEVVEEYNLGLAIDVIRNNVAQELDEYIAAFDIEMFMTGCERFLKKAKAENRQYEEALDFFCSGKDYAYEFSAEGNSVF